MFGTSLSGKWFWLLGLLVVSNIGYYLYNNWGLVTVKVTDAPLSKVINSIEWQGWVKIYSNLPPDTKVTMYVDHVSLADAMETLAANVDLPPQADDGTNPNLDRPLRPAGQFGNAAGASTNSPGSTGGAPGTTAGPDGGGGAGGPPGGRGGGGGGFGRRAEWNLAFFIAPTAADVKQEILKFETSDPDDSNKVYTAGGQMQLLASDSVTSAPDPRAQSWPGVKPPAPPSPDISATSAPTATSPADPSATPDAPVPIAQTYLQDFAEEANIWIMAPGTWTPDVSTPPPADTSIIHAVEKFVSNAHGAVTQAIILRVGRGGARGGPPNTGGQGNYAGNDDAWADRMRNAINGLPADQRPDALEQLNTEIEFRKKMRTIPSDQRRQMMMQHFMERMLYADRSRLSPEKRAKAYQRMIALREAAKAQK